MVVLKLLSHLWLLFLNALSTFVLYCFVRFDVSNVFDPATSKTPCVRKEGCAVVLKTLSLHKPF